MISLCQRSSGTVVLERWESPSVEVPSDTGEQVSHAPERQIICSEYSDLPRVWRYHLKLERTKVGLISD